MGRSNMPVKNKEIMIMDTKQSEGRQERIGLITGASSGIGFATARKFALNGWNVVMVTRSEEQGRKAANYIRAHTGNNKVSFLTADLSSLRQVRTLTEEIVSTLPRIDALINNAGVMLPARELSVDGFEMNWAVNHLAPMLIVERLKDWLRDRQPARIINVNSEGHRAELFSGVPGNIYFKDLQAEQGYSATRCYSQSKLANLMTSFCQAAHFRSSGVTLNCMHPGMVKTELGRKFSWWLRLVAGGMSGSADYSANCLFELATSVYTATLNGCYFIGNRPAEPFSLARNRITSEAVWRISMEQISPFF